MRVLRVGHGLIWLGVSRGTLSRWEEAEHWTGIQERTSSLWGWVTQMRAWKDLKLDSPSLQLFKGDPLFLWVNFTSSLLLKLPLFAFWLQLLLKVIFERLCHTQYLGIKDHFCTMYISLIGTCHREHPIESQCWQRHKGDYLHSLSLTTLWVSVHLCASVLNHTGWARWGISLHRLS